MTETLLYTGVWFLPDKPKGQRTGTLTFDPQTGGSLELIGTLVESRTSSDTHEPPIILGWTTDGKAVTLYRCFESGRSMSLPGMETSRYSMLYILVGHHFKENAALVFNTIRGRLSNLEAWMGQSGFRKIAANRETKTISIEYLLPDGVEFNVRPKASGRISYTSSAPTLGFSNSVTIEEKAAVTFRHENDTSLELLLEDFHHFQNFLTLGTYEACRAKLVEVTHDRLKQRVSKDVSIPVTIQVVYQQPIATKPGRDRVLWEFLFNYRDLSSFPETIERWYANKIELEPVIHLLLDSFYKHGTFSESTFLNISQALETFHRRFRRNQVLATADHKKMVEVILSTTDAEYQDWLKGKLNFSNEPTLHERLTELLEELSNNTVKKIVVDKAGFIRDTKNSRNYYTHYNRKLERKAKKGGDLFLLTERLKVILVCAVLKQTGFTHEQIESLFKRNEFKFFNHLISP